MRRLIRVLAPTVLLLALFLLAGCGDPAPSATVTSSGLQGTALVEGGPFPGSPRPDAGVAVAVFGGELERSIVTRADSSGTFAFDLPPGTYEVVHVKNAGSPQMVTIRPGEYVKVTLTAHIR
jgi:hypothetical protein